MEQSSNTKDAASRLDDPEIAYDSTTAPAAVKQPGVGKHAQHVDLHQADKPYSTAKHVGHTHPTRRTPEGEKKGCIQAWGRVNPAEVLDDEEGAAKDILQGPVAPESAEEGANAIREALAPDRTDAKTLTLNEYEKKIGHSV